MSDVLSTWFSWHSSLLGPGVSVLDVASGRGRHALMAAQLGANVTAIDGDADRLRDAKKAAQEKNLIIRWMEADLETCPLPEGQFDLVMVFNYLDRKRMSAIKGSVKPGGHLLAETFLEGQRALGWGPGSAAHLLEPGEILRLVDPFEVILAREVVEIVGTHPAYIASVLARRRE